MRADLMRMQNAGGATTVTLELHDGGDLELYYHDVGAAAQRTFGDGDYEAWLRIASDVVGKLAFALLAEKFEGKPDALSALKAFCAARGIPFQAGVWT